MYLATVVKQEDDSFPSYFYVLLSTVFILHQITWFTMRVALVAFHARISDPLVGGTFITLLNTFWNLGSMWSRSFSLWVVEQITVKSVFSR